MRKTKNYWLFFNITLCNEFLRHCSDDEISKFTTAEQDEIRSYRSEARFMRALSYLMVLDLYRKGPKVDENTPPTGYIPEAFDGTGLFDYIESELKSLVAEGSDEALPDTNEYSRASKSTAWALLARLYLNSAVYRGNVDTKYYTECITACHKVISNPAFYLEPEYAKLFNADNHKRTNEILFALVCDATTSVTWGGGTYLVCGSCGNSSTQNPADYGLTSGWGMFRARGEIVEKFGDIENILDSRAMFYTDSQEQYFTGAIDNQSEGYFFEKFTNLTDEGVAASNSAATGCSTDYPMIRLADIYLMAAEAYLRGGAGISKAEALELVNKVRMRAYRNDESGKISDSDLTLDFILDERGRELYLESVRRTDLVRFDKFTTDSYLWQWKGGVLDGRAVNDKFYTSGEDRREMECMQLLRDYCGVNSIRLRVWVNPAEGWNNIEDVTLKARRAEALGLRTMIDFHFSDTWADPGHQEMPQAWQGMTFEELKSAVASHVTDVLTSLKNAGVTPEWVQIGNETTPGMMLPAGDDM